MRKLASLIVILLSGCGPLPEAGADEPVDALRELLIVDEVVLSDPRARNAGAGVFSFSHAFSIALEDARDPSPPIADWLAALADDRDDASALDAQLTCPWLRSLPENECDSDCAVCVAREFTLTAAPFRLIGVAFRPDLGLGRDGFISAGEARLLFAATGGPGDDAAAPELPLTLIFEYALPSTNPGAEWARPWHALSGLVGPGTAYDDALAEIIARVTAGSDETGPHLARVRVDDALAGANRFSEWVVSADRARLEAHSLFNTPRPDAPAAALAGFIDENADLVTQQLHVVPSAWLATRARPNTSRFAADGIDARVAHAFGLGTCGGCHGAEADTIGGFHVAPGRRGTTRVSRFLLDREHPDRAELTRRADALREMLHSER
jgi:hypothetical protein